MTGVPITPVSGVMSPSPTPTSGFVVPEGTLVSPAVPPCAASIRLTDQSGAQGDASASNAYKLSCAVATRTTLWDAPLIVTLAFQSGCAYTAPSTAQEKSFPNFDGLTVPGA